MACFASEHTSSGVSCCGLGSSRWFARDDAPCAEAIERSCAAPFCPDGTVECAAGDGGACCPLNTTCSADGCIKILLAAEGFGSGLLEGLDGKTGSDAGLAVSKVEKATEASDDMDISDRVKRRETYIVLTKVGEVVQECVGRRTARESNMILLLAGPVVVALILAQF